MEHDERAEELEREVDDLEKRSDKVQSELDETKKEWEARQGDQGVPGAVAEGDMDVATGGEEGDGPGEDEGA